MLTDQDQRSEPFEWAESVRVIDLGLVAAKMGTIGALPGLLAASRLVPAANDCDFQVCTFAFCIPREYLFLPGPLSAIRGPGIPTHLESPLAGSYSTRDSSP